VLDDVRGFVGDLSGGKKQGCISSQMKEGDKILLFSAFIE
jgi:hypothetical protein